MDLWSIFILFLLTFLLMSCCGFCCTRKRRGAVLTAAPVVVTSSRVQSTQQGPYIGTQIPVASASAPTVNSSYPTQAYNRPYPTQPTVVHVPMAVPAMPPTSGYGPSIAAPLSQNMSAVHVMQPPLLPQSNTNPPPYDLAVAGSTICPPNIATSDRQAPYNPYFQK